MVPQSIIDIAEICYRKGIRKAVISPGSRNAPLTLAFVRHDGIETFSVPDERTAGFIALGMALESRLPCVLICTSGSAAYNYAPAVAEAFFSEVPLLLLTADRPSEWIDQWDGQTIYQHEIYGRHVKKSFLFPSEQQHDGVLWHAHRMINEAINIASHHPMGPTHINVPVREPFYPGSDQVLTPSEQIKIIKEERIDMEEISLNSMTTEINQYKKILIVVGQGIQDPELSEALKPLSGKYPIVADVISNLHELNNIVVHHDVFLRQHKYFDLLRPDLVIVCGMSVISKNLKLFLRKVQPAALWHIKLSGHVADTFQCLTRIIRSGTPQFFQAIHQLSTLSTNEEYHSHWLRINQRTADFLEDQLNDDDRLSEFKAVQAVLKKLPEHCRLHLANSMTVRYTNFFKLQARGAEVFCNRGTSGIDGSVSTAMGYALSTGKEVVLITGDMAFFYDRNAFWHNYEARNLKIILINNHGGGIFRLIKGPSTQPELEDYFETRQSLTARHLAEEYGLTYFNCNTLDALETEANLFFGSKGCAILEIETLAEQNKAVYDQILSSLPENLI